MRLIFAREPTALERLRAASWHCTTCNAPHDGIFHISAPAPCFWQAPIDPEPNSALRFDGNFLSEDFCVIAGTHFFVRAVLEIPVHGLADAFGFGIWVTLSRTNFETYLDGFDDGRYPNWGPWPGYFSNDVGGFGETLNQPSWVRPRPDRLRPLVTIVDERHPLAVAQREGITADRVLQIYASYGHVAGSGRGKKGRAE